MSSFDHSVFAVICGGFECLRTDGKFEVIDSEMDLLAAVSCSGVLSWLPVSMMLPFAVHFAEAM